MKVAFYNAAAAGGPVFAPDNNYLIHLCHVPSLPQADEMVIVGGATWRVQVVVHLVGPGDDYEARVWLRPAR